MISKITLLMAFLLISSVSNAFTSNLDSIMTSAQKVLGFSVPSSCLLYLEDLTDEEAPSYIRPGLRFYFTLDCDGKNVVSTQLLRDDNFNSIEKIKNSVAKSLKWRWLSILDSGQKNGQHVYRFKGPRYSEVRNPYNKIMKTIKDNN